MTKTLEDVNLLEEYWVRRSRVSFATFRRFMSPKMKWNWFTEELCEHLQQFYEDYKAGKAPKLVVQAPPQHGKSEAVTFFLAWLAGKDPDAKQIYASFSERLGVRANLKLQRIFDGDKYRRIFPDTNINRTNSVAVSGQYLRNREIMEFVGREGYFRNTTVCGSITGESLDIGTIDDPIKGRAAARSKTVRDSTWHWLTDDFFTRFSEHGALLIILTRWHIDDPVGRLIERDPLVKVVKYQAIAEKDEKHRKKGEPLFPQHKSLRFLESIRGNMPATSWASLYQQTPTLEAGEMFKPDKIEVVDTAPAGTRWVRAWDLASSKEEGDHTASVRLGVAPDGRYVIGHVTRERLLTDDRDKHMQTMAGVDGHHVAISIPQDPGQAGKSQVASMVKKLSGYTVHTSTESGSKETRADAFASQVNAGNVMMVRGPWNQDYLDELRYFPQGTFDDQVDASSRAFNYVSEKLQRGIFEFDLPQYHDVPHKLYKLVMRIKVANNPQEPHGYSVLGYTMANDFDTMNQIMLDAGLTYTHAMDKQVEYTYIIDAGKWYCSFAELPDNIVKVLEQIGSNMLPRERFDGIIIEDDGTGATLRQVLLEHRKLRHWEGVRIGLTPSYNNELARAQECLIQLQQGKLLTPSCGNRYSSDATDLEQFVREFNTFTNDGSHATSNTLSTVIWEVATKHGQAPRTVWYP